MAATANGDDHSTEAEAPSTGADAPQRRDAPAVPGADGPASLPHGMRVAEFDELPSLGSLYLEAGKAALPMGRGGSDAGSRSAAVAGALPDQAAVAADVEVELDAVADYARVCGFRLADEVPITWPHLLGFPLSMWLMTRDDFPHQLLGLVHVGNRIESVAPVRIGDRVDVTAQLRNQRPHAKGIQFDAVSEVRRDGDVVWSSTSTYLRRGATGASSEASADLADTPASAEAPTDAAGTSAAAMGDDSLAAVDMDALPFTAKWQLGADLGRRYGQVSGDRNPIHLSALTAKAFGFPRAIAHGMWTKAAALAALPRPQGSVAVDVAFRKPVLLPSSPTLATSRTDTGWHFALRRRDGAPHLVGLMQPL